MSDIDTKIQELLNACDEAGYKVFVALRKDDGMRSYCGSIKPDSEEFASYMSLGHLAKLVLERDYE